MLKRIVAIRMMSEPPKDYGTSEPKVLKGAGPSSVESFLRLGYEVFSGLFLYSLSHLKVTESHEHGSVPGFGDGLKLLSQFPHTKVTTYRLGLYVVLQCHPGAATSCKALHEIPCM